MAAIALFRRDSDPNGSGLHDWFQSDNTQEDANWYGIKWAITHRPLKYPWKPTQFSHVFENDRVSTIVPTWLDLENVYGRP